MFFYNFYFLKYLEINYTKKNKQLKVVVLKTGKGATFSWVRISVLPPFDLFSIFKMYNYYYFLFKRRKND